MADVFISYAREDRARAEQVARGLEALGLTPFWDTDIPPGQTWADYIEGKLSACKAVVVLWSQHSTKSQWVREEARMGRDKAKLIPAILDGASPPLGFGEVQAANLTNWRGAANDAEWSRFANAVYGAVRDGAAAPHAAQSAVAPSPAAPRFVASPPIGSTDGEKLSPLGYIQKCFRLYASGKGRARRSEYWWWILFTVGVTLIATLIDIMAFGFNAYTQTPNNTVFYMIASLAILAPTAAVMSRRFHDIGLNGWFVAGVFAAYLAGALMMAAGIEGGDVLVGIVVLGVLVITIMPSKPGENQYGLNPKGA